MGKGLLFRVDLATKKVTAIDTAGASAGTVPVLDDRTLYVVRQTAVDARPSPSRPT